MTGFLIILPFTFSMLVMGVMVVGPEMWERWLTHREKMAAIKRGNGRAV